MGHMRGHAMRANTIVVLALIGGISSGAAWAQANSAAVVSASANANPGSVLSIGGDLSGTGISGYAAGTFAVNGDQYSDGVLVRVTGGAGEYKSGTTPFAAGGDVSFYSLSGLIGYQKVSGNVKLSGFIGPELVHNGHDADRRVRGSKLAGRIIGEVALPGREVDLSFWSTYSTFENQYYVSGRAQFHGEAGKGGIGPDVALFGGDGWQRGRGGLFATIPSEFGEIGVGGGYDWDLRGHIRESAYGNVSISLPFR